MNYSKDPLGQDALIAEASRWLAALDSGTADKQAFDAWRSDNPANAVAYARVVANWESVSAAADTCPQPAELSTSRRQLLRVAAVGVPMFLLGSGFAAQRAYAWESASTAVGETKRIALPDGSIAYLNTDSALSWRFRGDARALRLERGEVALDIRSGSAPILHANESAFPLGRGLFDARISAGQAVLTLVDGAAVDVPAAERRLMLRPNEAVIVDSGKAPRIETRNSENVASLVAWRAGEIIFHDQTVAEAATDFNRYLTRKIVIGNADLAREKIGGRFDLDRPDQFLKAVSLSFDARVVTTAGGYELTR